MQALTEEQAGAFVQYARTVLERVNNPPVEDAARILAFVDGATQDYVHVRRHVQAGTAAAILEGFMVGRANMTPQVPGQEDDYADVP